MLVSLALIFLVGMIFGKIFEKAGLPSLLGFLLTGIILGPHVLNLFDPIILQASTDLRQIALIIILARAGLNLEIRELKQVGRPALFMCFVPACFEIVGTLLLAPKLLGLSRLDAAILGTVVAAVSPAIVVPRMLNIIDQGYGLNKGIPQLILAGAAVDDIFVIILFTSLTSLAQSGSFTWTRLLTIPSSIVFGLLGGVIIGTILLSLFRKFPQRDTKNIILVLAVSFVLVTLETVVPSYVGFSGLLAVMAVGSVIQRRDSRLAKRLAEKLAKLWVGAEILLFVLVGASVQISYAFDAGIQSVLLILVLLSFRTLGVLISLLGTNLTNRERLFVVFAYLPKATVQAAIGGLPLAMGLHSGEIILTIAVLAIFITAPLGAFLIERFYHTLLVK